MDPCTHLMFALDSPARVDMATDLAIPLVAREGWHVVTPARIAAAARCSRQAVSQWFGDQHALRLAVARRFSARWSRWSEVRVGLYGPVGLLPQEEPERDWVRVWLSLREAARDRELQGLVAGLVDAERACLLRYVENEVWRRHSVAVSALTPAVLDLHAVLDGLRLQLAAGAPAPDVARRLVADALDRAVETCLTSSKATGTGS